MSAITVLSAYADGSRTMLYVCVAVAAGPPVIAQLDQIAPTPGHSAAINGGDDAGLIPLTAEASATGASGTLSVGALVSYKNQAYVVHSLFHETAAPTAHWCCLRSVADPTAYVFLASNTVNFISA